MAEQAGPELSIVVPVFDEAMGILEFYGRLADVLDGLEVASEIVFVNDGSSDDTLQSLMSIRELDSRIAIIDLSRNFGKEVAMTAGLDFAHGRAVIIIDADLQDPPELIPALVEKWREGNDVVYAQRRVRKGETWFKRRSAHWFYRLMEKIGTVHIPRDTGDFRLLSRRAVDALAQLGESHRFMKGLFTWIGFEQVAVEYDRSPRAAGESKWNYWSLWNLAIEGITSFTVSPLRISTYVGLLVAIGAFLYGAFVLFRTLFFGTDLPGYPSIMVVILFMGGVQLIAVGVIGEYLGRIFNETKNRPLYFVKDVLPAVHGESESSSQ
jgi:glycosyltransferase involved in cell wall biosynthesis